MQTVTAIGAVIDFDHPRQGAADVKKAGFNDVLLDFSSACPPGLLEGLGKANFQSSRRSIAAEQPDRLGEALREFLRQCQKEGIGLLIARAPYLDIDTKRGDLQDRMRALVLESIRLCGEQGCPYLIVRPYPVSGAEEARHQDFYLSLAQAAGEHHVTLLIENRCRDMGGHPVRGPFCDEKETAAFLDELNRLATERHGLWNGQAEQKTGGSGSHIAGRQDNYFGFCMNVGTCNLCGQNMYDFAAALGDRIKAVILRDCDGSSDASQIPFTCVKNGQTQTDWLNLIRGLRRIRFDGCLIMDYVDTAAACSPILKPQLLALAKAQGDYFAWQIGMERMLAQYSSRVLFGAGNMCRNYMKNYGENYPPLFTCDNNSALWGTEFCGLTVRPPEALLDLPPECAVYICNIYYREIETQLREMGIKNPVEYFNDEYMPSFYTDRLDAVTREYDKKSGRAEREEAAYGRQEKR